MATETLLKHTDKEIEEVFIKRALDSDRRLLGGKELANEAKKDLEEYMKLFGLEELEDK
ncbi:hypothetical protein [Ureibacillus manganicus]|uniref:hypothetical protein n=1 Tax=Ureibacillus manganicus TaxID=1266064 RepID=UPI000AC34A28|nr:hypothetical protein [Ureibacillus manganicus]